MKVLIIEDTEPKFQSVVHILSINGITDYYHIKNLAHAETYCFIKKHINKFDLIILDMCFPFADDVYVHLDLNSGAKFICQMVEHDIKIPVIVFSTDSYQERLNQVLFPSFAEYSTLIRAQFNTKPIIVYEEQYLMVIDENKKKMNAIDFVIGQAHDLFELQDLIKQFLADSPKD